MQQVKSSLEQKIKQMQISLSGEPVLRLAGLSAATLPHMDYEVAGTPAQRKVWQDKIDSREQSLRPEGCCHDALPFLSSFSAYPHQPVCE